MDTVNQEPKVNEGFLVTPRPDQDDIVIQVYGEGQEILYAELTRRQAFELSRVLQKAAVVVDRMWSFGIPKDMLVPIEGEQPSG